MSARSFPLLISSMNRVWAYEDVQGKVKWGQPPSLIKKSWIKYRNVEYNYSIHCWCNEIQGWIRRRLTCKIHWWDDSPWPSSRTHWRTQSVCSGPLSLWTLWLKQDGRVNTTQLLSTHYSFLKIKKLITNNYKLQVYNMEWVQTLITGLIDHPRAMKRNAKCAKSTFPVDTSAAVTILIIISETNHIKFLGLIIIGGK